MSLVLANLWILSSGRRFMTTAMEASSADLIVVLGCAVYGDTPSAVLRRRLEVALSLHARGVAPRILVSGRQRLPDYDEPGVMRQLLLDAGIVDDDILIDITGHRTFASLEAVRLRFAGQRVIVVTSAFHLPRSVFLARRLGMEVQGVAASDDGFSAGSQLRWHLREFVARGRAVVDVLLARRFPPRRHSPPTPGPLG